MLWLSTGPNLRAAQGHTHFHCWWRKSPRVLFAHWQNKPKWKHVSFKSRKWKLSSLNFEIEAAWNRIRSQSGWKHILFSMSSWNNWIKQTNHTKICDLFRLYQYRILVPVNFSLILLVHKYDSSEFQVPFCTFNTLKMLPTISYLLAHTCEMHSSHALKPAWFLIWNRHSSLITCLWGENAWRQVTHCQPALHLNPISSLPSLQPLMATSWWASAPGRSA